MSREILRFQWAPGRDAPETACDRRRQLAHEENTSTGFDLIGRNAIFVCRPRTADMRREVFRDKDTYSELMRQELIQSFLMKNGECFETFRLPEIQKRLEAVEYNAFMVFSIPLLLFLTIADINRSKWPRLYLYSRNPVLSWTIFASVLLWWIIRNIFSF